MTEATDHDMRLGYTTDDDGIWLWCSCGYDELLGFNPSPVLVAERANTHVDESSPEADR